MLKKGMLIINFSEFAKNTWTYLCTNIRKKEKENDRNIDMLVITDNKEKPE